MLLTYSQKKLYLDGMLSARTADAQTGNMQRRRRDAGIGIYAFSGLKYITGVFRANLLNYNITMCFSASRPRSRNEQSIFDDELHSAAFTSTSSVHVPCSLLSQPFPDLVSPVRSGGQRCGWFLYVSDFSRPTRKPPLAPRHRRRPELAARGPSEV